MSEFDDDLGSDYGALVVSGPGGANPSDIAPGSFAMSVQNGIMTAQKVAIARDLGKVMTSIAQLGAAAGSDWFYSIPFKDRKQNKTVYVEGLSIKGAMEVARMFGNCQVDMPEVTDAGGFWIFHARFVDYETGFNVSRPYQQRKKTEAGGSMNAERAMDIAFQIGASKAMRNVIVNALQSATTHAFQCAKRALVDKVAKDPDRYLTRVITGLDRVNIELLRVERVRGKPAKEWNAKDIALVIGEMQSIADGMATWDELFPVPGQEQDSSGDTVTDLENATEGADAGAPTAEKGNPPDKTEAKAKPDPKAKAPAKPRAAAKPAEEPKPEPAADGQADQQQKAEGGEPAAAEEAREPEAAGDQQQQQQEPAAEESTPAGATDPHAEFEADTARDADTPGDFWDKWLAQTERELAECPNVIKVQDYWWERKRTLAGAPQKVQEDALRLHAEAVAAKRGA